MSFSDWGEALDEMERRLVAAERILAGDPTTVSPPPFAKPIGLGPLPPEQRDRAAAVHAATRRLEARLAAELDAVAAQLEREPVAPVAGRPAPTYFDRSA